VVDEAHGTGAVGPGGRGAVAEAGLEDAVDVVVGTLGKALGSYGAYACCDTEMARFLINAARTLIFSTAPPPPAIAGALAALALLREQPRRVERLQSNGEALREALEAEGFPPAASTTQIVPLVVGKATDAMRMCEEAIARGVFAQAIRPPTVPEGTSRLRLAVMASHTRAELRDAARHLAAAARAAGLEPESLPRLTAPAAPAPYDAEATDPLAAEAAAGPFDGDAGSADGFQDAAATRPVRPFDGEAAAEVAEAA
jgi:glycine C-acetyltransferase/8-amino-7-oxononanoate synthase